MADRYAEGFDENGKWTLASAYEALRDQGAIVKMGMITPAVARSLDRLVAAGKLVKYRGHWDTLLPFVGMGPLKTIWVVPELGHLAEARRAA